MIDFFGDTGATGSYFVQSGTGLAEMINAQTLTGPTGIPWPYLGACRLHVQAPGDDAEIDLSQPSGKQTSDAVFSLHATIALESAFKVQSIGAPGNSTQIQFFGADMGFLLSLASFGNENWWVFGDPAHPGGFDTGVALDTLRVHVYRMEQSPAGPMTWYIDGVVVHTTVAVPAGSAFNPFMDCNSDAGGSQDVLIDYITWTVAIPNRVP